MPETSILESALIVLLAAVVIVSVAPRLRISPVVGYLIAGAVIGPGLTNLVHEPHDLEVLADLGIVFLLFGIGLELSFERLRSLRSLVFGLGGTQVVATAAIVALVAWLSGQSWPSAILLGGALALSSTAFVMQLLVERREAAAHFALVAFAVLLLQDLAVLPLLALVRPLAGGDGDIVLTLAGDLARAVGAVAVTLLAGRYLLQPLFRHVALSGHRDLFVPTALLVVLGAAWAMTLVGLSMALGALLAGLLLSSTEWRHQVEADLRPFKGLFLGFFFMYVGMSADLEVLASSWYLVVALAVGLMVGKAILIFFLCRAMGESRSVAFSVAGYLSQGGEFAFVLLSAAAASGVVPLGAASIAMAAVVVTLALTPLSTALGRRLAVREERTQPIGKVALASAAEELSDHILIAGYGRVGQTVAQLAIAQGMEHLALDLDPSRVARCRARGQQVFFGDASRAELLEAAGAARARAVVVTLDDRSAASHLVRALREMHPELPIYARARDLDHAKALENDGATFAVPEAVEGSLHLGAVVLEDLGQEPAEVEALIASIRAEGYAGLTRVPAASVRRGTGRTATGRPGTGRAGKRRGA